MKCQQFLCYSNSMPDDNFSENIKGEGIQNDTESEAVNPQAPPNNPPSPPAKTISEQRVENEVQAISDRVKRAEWLMIGLTACIVLLTLGLVIVGILQWRVMSWQLSEMKSGGVDTHDLALAAKDQAAAANKTLGEMKAGRADTHALSVAAGKQADASSALADLTARQFTASQLLIESQRALISVAFASVLNPITFHGGGLSFAFSVTMKNDGRLPAKKVKVRFTPYFSQWGSTLFSEPMERQRGFCNKPNMSRDSRTAFEGLTNEDALTIISGDTKESQINFGMGAPTDSDIIRWPPDEAHLPQTKRVFPIVVGCIDYQSGAMPEPHQTGFIFQIQRGDPRMPTFITFGENVRREDVVVVQYFFGQGKSY